MLQTLRSFTIFIPILTEYNAKIPLRHSIGKIFSKLQSIYWRLHISLFSRVFNSLRRALLRLSVLLARLPAGGMQTGIILLYRQGRKNATGGSVKLPPDGLFVSRHYPFASESAVRRRTTITR